MERKKERERERDNENESIKYQTYSATWKKDLLLQSTFNCVNMLRSCKLSLQKGSWSKYFKAQMKI